MSVTDTSTEIETPARAYETVYGAFVTDNAQTVLNETFVTKSDRRNAVVALLLANHDEVQAEAVEAILAPFGGASADVALGQVVALYAPYGIDVDLGEYLCDVGPVTLYSAFTVFGDGRTFAEHYGSNAERLAELRLRAASSNTAASRDAFDEADEATCVAVIRDALSRTNGRLDLFEAQREDVGGAYTTH